MHSRRNIQKLGLALIPFMAMLLNTSNVYAQQRKSIEIKRANFAKNLKKDGKSLRRIIGNVLIYHDGITLECDSVYDYTGTQQFDAFGNVVITQGATKLYGDVLYYDGATRIGKIRGKVVRMVDSEAVLVTKFLDFNTANSNAYFFNGGIVTSDDSRLYSDRGRYLSKNKQYYFGGNVALQNPDFLMNTDSLEYNSNTNLANFHGPTRLYSSDGYIYSEKGWYNRSTKQADLLLNAFVDNGEQKLFGDRIYYDQAAGYMHSQGNVVMIDSVQNTIIYGGEAKYWEQTKDALVTVNPLMIMVSEEGDSLYLRANKLAVKTLTDSSLADPNYRIFRAIGEARFFRHDFQGVCDSMVMNTADSMMHMYVNPIIWNEENQLTADKISALYKDNKIHRMYFRGSAFISSQEEDKRFNQIKGKQMEAYFRDGKLRKLDVTGNGQTVYFVRDKGKIVAANRAESVNLSIMISNNTVTSILFRSKPTATLFPINKAEPEDLLLVGFQWHNDIRPKGKREIIPQDLTPYKYKPVEGKAMFYKNLKKNPAETL